MFGKKAIAPLVLILISLALFVFSLFELEKSNSAIWGIISNILLILAMVLIMVGRKKKSKRITTAHHQK